MSTTSSICRRFQATPEKPVAGSRVGLAIETLKTSPIHGLRVRPTETTNGWYIWCGERSDAADFFSPLCVEHVSEYLPEVLPYLELPPGYRFVIDRHGFEDVWYDQHLLFHA